MENQAFINRKGLSAKEKAILFDKYRQTVKNDQSEIDENSKSECCICIDEFMVDDNVLIHPLCKHIYHLECVQDWFESKMNCPLCKIQTREAMVRTMSTRGTNVASEKDGFLFNSKDDNGDGVEDA